MVIKKKTKELAGENSFIVFLLYFTYCITSSSLMVDLW